ncbi:formyltransferase family protein [Halarcobacter sp.]|uniref:methionyl-tRNA formyltransferase n=1 Tax=Halarcobacter sp. TaxID=2321133 RepID=UPI002AAAFC9A|nr:formyltransferase family protein [Halarcobacter sp.]
MLDKKICMIGCHEVGYNIIKYLLENGIKINYFVILSPHQGKKYQISGYFDFTSLASKYNIPIRYPKLYSLQEQEDLDFFREHNFDLLIQGGWQRLIPKKVLDTLSIGGIGVHGSANFLPYGRGRSPLNWSLIEGRKRFIMQLFIMKSGADDGDIFDYEQFDINEYDDIKTLYYKNSIVTKRMLLRCIPKLLNSEIEFFSQMGEPSFYPKRTSDDGMILWEKWNIDKINNFIRALTKPYPGAFSYIGNEKIYIWKAQLFDRSIKYNYAKYGEVVEVFDNENFIINCLDGLLLVTEYESNISIKINTIFGVND